MSKAKKQKETINNRRLLERLMRLDVVKALSIEVLIAYIGLLLVNKGNVIEIPKALKIIKQSKLHIRIQHNTHIPTENVLESLIHLVIYKRELLQQFFDNKELPVWNHEITAPLFDIMYNINKVYKI